MALAASLTTGCASMLVPSEADQPEAGKTARPKYGLDKNATQRLAAYAAFRGWDPCAMHDPVAAAKNPKLGKGDELEPDDLNGCILRTKLNEDPVPDGWRLSIELGQEFGPGRREDADPVQIGSRQVFKQRPLGGALGATMDKGRCYFYVPAIGEYATSFSVNWNGMSDRPMATSACEAGTAYLTAVLPLWADPPRRADGLTSPRLKLADQDPCEAAKELEPLFGPGNEADIRPMSPYECQFQLSFESRMKQRQQGQPGGGGSKSSGPEVEIEFTWGASVAGLTEGGRGQWTPLKIGGHSAYQDTGGMRGGCRIGIQYDKTTLGGTSRDEQIIEIQASDCELAKRAAEPVLKAAKS